MKTCNNCGSEVHTNTKECKCGNTEFISNISNLEVKSRIDTLEEARKIKSKINEKEVVVE